MIRDPIDEYLRKLRRRWWWRRDRDRRLAEIEDHLKSAAEDLQVEGRSSHDAARAAVARYHSHAGLWLHHRRVGVAIVAAFAASATFVGLLVLMQSSSGTRAAQQPRSAPPQPVRAAAPFAAPIDLEGGSGSGLWGDTTSGPSGQGLGCRSGRRYAMAVSLRNHSASTITITAVRGPEPAPRIIRRVAVQVRLAPPPSSDGLFIPSLRGWSDSPLVPVAIPPGKGAVVQSNFLMGRCAALRPHQALTVNRAIVVSYRVGDHVGRQEVAAPAAQIILTHGPTIQTCARPQGATRLIASDITCTLAERTATSCHQLAHGTWGWCTTASRKWDCTFTSASRAFERCWLPSKRQSISVRWD